MLVTWGPGLLNVQGGCIFGSFWERFGGLAGGREMGERGGRERGWEFLGWVRFGIVMRAFSCPGSWKGGFGEVLASRYCFGSMLEARKVLFLQSTDFLDPSGNTLAAWVLEG